MSDYAFGQKPLKPKHACCFCGRRDDSLGTGEGQYYCGCQPRFGGERYIPMFRCTQCSLPFATMAQSAEQERMVADMVRERGNVCDRCFNAPSTS